MTVYKAVKDQAAAAADAADRPARRREPATRPAPTVEDTGATATCRPCWPTPVAIYKDNVKHVIDDGFVDVADVCTAELAAACTEAGIQ